MSSIVENATKKQKKSLESTIERLKLTNGNIHGISNMSLGAIHGTWGYLRFPDDGDDLQGDIVEWMEHLG